MRHAYNGGTVSGSEHESLVSCNFEEKIIIVSRIRVKKYNDLI